jgi:regulator of replication initiation timing
MKTLQQIEEQFNKLTQELSQLQTRGKEISEELLRLQGEHRLLKELETAPATDETAK